MHTTGSPLGDPLSPGTLKRWLLLRERNRRVDRQLGDSLAEFIRIEPARPFVSGERNLAILADKIQPIRKCLVSRTDFVIDFIQQYRDVHLKVNNELGGQLAPVIVRHRRLYVETRIRFGAVRCVGFFDVNEEELHVFAKRFIEFAQLTS